MYFPLSSFCFCVLTLLAVRCRGTDVRVVLDTAAALYIYSVST
jgi:hypothetical protein